MQTRIQRKLSQRMGLLAILAVGLAAVALAAVIPLPNGANLEVTIGTPAQDEEFKVPVGATDIDVDTSGTASIGQGTPDVGLIVVVDVSFSTTLDCDGTRNILQCERDAVNNLLTDPNIGSVAEVGIAVFGEGGAAADMTPAGGDDPSTTSIADAQTVVGSIVVGGVNQFAVKGVGDGATNYSAGLAAATTIAGAQTTGTKLVIFLSDGLSNTGGGSFAANLAALQGLVDTIFPFAIGSGASCTGGSDGDLADMGDCEEVDPDELENLIPDLLSTTLESVEAEADGNPLIVTTNPPVPADGPVSVDWSATAFGLVPDDHQICATATGSDSTGSDSVQECVDIHLLQLTASPEAVLNELNFDNEHTVMAEIVGGSGPVRNIDFLVGGQNAGTAMPPNASIPTAPNAPVQFFYMVPQVCDSLGVDTITVSTTIAGTECSIELGKEWIDTVPPEVSCDPSVNPHGNEPQAPGQGQNEDGFYQLNSEDPVLFCEVTLMVTDGDGFVFPGPFVPGDVIKYTQADGAPQQQKKMGSGNGQAGQVRWHLKGHGDLTVTATDTSGNSAFASCLVPPPPQ